jgi:hypothetical protein
MWPVVAWMVTLVMQSAGRVCRRPSVLSAASRCFPVICSSETAAMVYMVLIVQLNTGCSWRVAMQHIWFDRFEKESDTIDEELRLFASALVDLEMWLLAFLQERLVPRKKEK